VQIRSIEGQHAGQSVIVTAEVFAGTVDDDVGAERQGLDQDRGEECAVDDGQQVMLSRQLAHRPDIDDFQHRIGRDFEEDRFRIGLDGCLCRSQVGQIDKSSRDAVALEDFCDQAINATIEVIREDEMGTGREKLDDR